MIKNTELYYAKMKAFQDKRAELTEAHDKKVKSFERFKGSKGYEEDLKKENERFEAELKALREEYRSSLLTVIGGMMDAIGRRSISAPTEGQINLLNVLKMKRKVTLEECQRTAEAVKDNPIAVSVVTEIAHDHGIMQSFDNLCPEMSSKKAAEIVTGIKNGLDDYLQFDTTKASRIARDYYKNTYGGAINTPLPKRQLFSDQAEFYRKEVGLDGESLRQFAEIVDA